MVAAHIKLSFRAQRGICFFDSVGARFIVPSRPPRPSNVISNAPPGAKSTATSSTDLNLSVID